MVKMKTPEDFFEKILPKRFKPEKAEGVDVSVNIDIVGDNGGKWTVIIKNQKIKIEKGHYNVASLSLKISEKDYLEIIEDKLSGEKAFFTGKLKLEGDISLVLKLKDMGFF